MEGEDMDKEQSVPCRELVIDIFRITADFALMISSIPFYLWLIKLAQTRQSLSLWVVIIGLFYLEILLITKVTKVISLWFKTLLAAL